MYHLYAYTVDSDEIIADVAYVKSYNTSLEAREAKDINMLSFSDEGIFFAVLGSHPIPSPNTTFERLVERYSK